MYNYYYVVLWCDYLFIFGKWFFLFLCYVWYIIYWLMVLFVNEEDYFDILYMYSFLLKYGFKNVGYLICYVFFYEVFREIFYYKM